MGLHSRLPQGAAGHTPDVAQYHTMHSAQYLEDQATALLNAAAPKSRSRANSLASSSATDMFSTDSDALSLWQQAAGIYSTDGDDGELSWQADALCAQTDPEAFFPEKGGSTRDAKRVCSECPVREACLEYAMENDERFGIWGGLSERERRRLRKQAI
ncbi:WhiB family transcriptional regulator [Rothia nasimurium]|uniref:WhiB family transcriptional regulator n=1 Tax=Rothia nasimurium TaxID=85336 RepID=UPI002DD676CD|nr:WhiB family transcriptional regulator [Rothia nasimurium]